MKFVRCLYNTARLCLWRQGKSWLQGALRVTVEVGLPEGCMAELEEIVLGDFFYAFRRALTGKTPTCVVPMRVALKQGTDLT